MGQSKRADAEFHLGHVEVRRPLAEALNAFSVPHDQLASANDKTFLGLPVTWIPTTWVFREGHLATAFNYGEVTREQLDEAITGAQSDW